mmetsp:Transcript_10293/g.34040  ORF Transcript_10293/g.34040 Transcript_10293/m.34040 type:complete len:258 (+) Transcript_10293:1115-1888(+)
MVSGEWGLPLFHALFPLFAAPIFNRRSISVCALSTFWKQSLSPTKSNNKVLSTATTLEMPCSARNRRQLQFGHRHPTTWCFCCCLPTTNPPSKPTNTGSLRARGRDTESAYGYLYDGFRTGVGASWSRVRRETQTGQSQVGSCLSLRTKKPLGSGGGGAAAEGASSVSSTFVATVAAKPAANAPSAASSEDGGFPFSSEGTPPGSFTSVDSRSTHETSCTRPAPRVALASEIAPKEGFLDSLPSRSQFAAALTTRAR